jgi:hypothetical protein
VVTRTGREKRGRLAPAFAGLGSIARDVLAAQPGAANVLGYPVLGGDLFMRRWPLGRRVSFASPRVVVVRWALGFPFCATAGREAWEFLCPSMSYRTRGEVEFGGRAHRIRNTVGTCLHT